MNPNNIGHVLEFCSDTELSKEGILVPKCTLKVQLRNTLGELKTLTLEAPADLGGFFNP